MLKSISQKTKLLYDATKSVPVGFGKLFKEAKHIAKFQFNHVKNLIRRSESKLSRKEINQTRSHTESVKRLLPILLFYVVPIIGNFPIFIALIYPKHLLTYHFWSDEQKILFLHQEFNERRDHAFKLFNNNKNIYQNKQMHENVEYLLSLDDMLRLSNLTNAHLRCLAGSNGIFSNQFLLNTSPKWVLLFKLRKRAREILQEDKLILDDSLGDCSVSSWNSIMSLVELQQFCSRRGFEAANHPPSSIPDPGEGTDHYAHNMPKVNSRNAIDEMAHFYRDWMECSVSTARELHSAATDAAEAAAAEDRGTEGLRQSLTLHLIALSALRNA